MIVSALQMSWKFSLNRRLSVLACGVSILGAVLLSACDPGAGVTWINETDETVVVHLSDEPNRDSGTTVLAHSSKTEAVISDVWNDVVVVRNEEGAVLLRVELTWNELEDGDFKFVISPADLGASP